MKVGDIVGLKHCTDFKGILLNMVEYMQDEYGENELKRWKVLWFKHPYGATGDDAEISRTHPPCVEVYSERGLCPYVN